MDKQLRSFQDKLFKELQKELETGKSSQLFSPILYRSIEKAYKKGFKRGKYEIIEMINNIKL